VVQEELKVLDRVRFGGAFSTSPCMQKLAMPKQQGGCGREFVPDYDYVEETEPTTNSTEFDAEFGFGSDVEDKQILMQYAPHALRLLLIHSRLRCVVPISIPNNATNASLLFRSPSK
jgi:hypothetical protein